jgi:hypothetical protein
MICPKANGLMVLFSYRLQKLVLRLVYGCTLLGLIVPAQPMAAQELPPSGAGIPQEVPAEKPGDGETKEPWRATVELYGFVPVRSWGTTTIRGFEAEVDTSLAELIPLIETVGSARGSLENGRFGLLADLYYAQIGDQQGRSKSIPLPARGQVQQFTGQVQQTAIQGLYDFAFRYRFGTVESAIGKPGQVTVIPYAGVRVLKNELDLLGVLEGRGPLEFRLQKQGNWQRTWAQPLLGTQASVFLTPGLRAFARGDIGGFGLAGAEDLSGNAQVGVGIALGNNTQLDLSWRYFGLDWSNGADRETGFSVRQNGFEAGLKFFF